ncbi:unnamed protein product [Rotaria sp. Silwood1]|nr:unnamed protein product [Rotaria sp. Silwood1]CAF0939599.1 unnamed protein product [Rotaria sp. Silwood1]CAF3392494.1 unnamed protein product [Rotaria sp. Silwood1]CAF4590012.1 unnamed protein product [Rotaria sp. Silwood1]
MKSIVMFHLLIIFTVYFTSTFSYTSNNGRLYNLIRTPMNIKDKVFTLPIGNNKDRFTPVLNQQLNSIEDEASLRARSSWDSGEDYFTWAKKNRRPVEYFTGRKRETGKAILPPRRRYDHDGLWRSGLVG